MGAKANNPRSGSMAYWPRVRAKKVVPRVHAFPEVKDVKLVGFAGFKVGMTHVFYTETRKNARFAGEEVCLPTTILECPPIKIYAVRFYKKDAYGLSVAKDIVNSKLDKELGRTVILPKNSKNNLDEDASSYCDVRLLVYTQPRLTGIGQKRPQIFEIAIGGKSVEEKIKYAKDNLEKEIPLTDVFKEGEYVDVVSVTKGKGVQGPLKRFGISRKRHKSEKGTRRPGSLCGGWSGQGHMMYRAAQAGKMGYHTRKVFNLKIMKISQNPAEIKTNGGHVSYGDVKNTFLLLKGSVPGPKKRLIRLTMPIRPLKLQTPVPISVEYIDTTSKQ